MSVSHKQADKGVTSTNRSIFAYKIFPVIYQNTLHTLISLQHLNWIFVSKGHSGKQLVHKHPLNNLVKFGSGLQVKSLHIISSLDFSYSSPAHVALCNSLSNKPEKHITKSTPVTYQINATKTCVSSIWHIHYSYYSLVHNIDKGRTALHFYRREENNTLLTSRERIVKCRWRE